MTSLFIILSRLLLSVYLMVGVISLHSQDRDIQAGRQLRASLEQDIKGRLSQRDFLLKGKHYQYVYPRIQGSHLLRGKPEKGKVLFDGISFTGLTLSYDMYNDLIFSTSIQKEGNRNIILSSHKLPEFWIDGYHFIRLDSSPDSSLLLPGFYQLAYEKGDEKILVKWKVKVNRYAPSVASSKSGQKPYKFIPIHDHLLFMGDEVHLIKKKKDLLEILENTAEVKSYMKQNRIKLNSTDPDVISSELIQVLSFLNP